MPAGLVQESRSQGCKAAVSVPPSSRALCFVAQIRAPYAEEARSIRRVPLLRQFPRSTANESVAFEDLLTRPLRPGSFPRRAGLRVAMASAAGERGTAPSQFQTLRDSRALQAVVAVCQPNEQRHRFG